MTAAILSSPERRLIFEPASLLARIWGTRRASVCTTSAKVEEDEDEIFEALDMRVTMVQNERDNETLVEG